jgi:peptide alpha-N-acetyltransferase
MAQNNQILPAKEQALFRHLVQNYETKQYKKGIKAAEQILRKHPNHGDTQAMKALILSNQGKTEEAFDLCKLGLKNAMKSHVCWHVYGLLYRGVKNYDEAIKAYRFALRLDPDSQQIQRDLALLQVQMRDWAGFVQSRNQMLQARPSIRQNWTALAVALHLSGELEKAEDILTRYEDTLKTPPSKGDSENAEALLYKNSIIAERGDTERALEHLKSIYKSALDRAAVMELKAQYLLQLGRLEDAEKAYRVLLTRNPEKRLYYDGLEKALGLKRDSAEDRGKLAELYQILAKKSDRVDAPQRIPLDFLDGDAFRQHADAYLRRMFKKGIPSTFANLKQLYSDTAKRDTIQALVQGYVNEELAEGSNSDAETKPDDRAVLKWKLSVNYFLAQHYNYHLSRDLSKAQQYIETAISLNPSKTDYTYHMTRARIQKNLGNVEQASKFMNTAREMDLKDRYINTKCAKYQLRNNEHENAIDTMGLFTRKEAVGGPLGDLLDMQCVWFITEDGESYLRQGNIALALKRFKAVYDIFEVWTEDQFDFHTFSLRKGVIRAYVDMIRWEDDLREHPFYTRAALSAIHIYLKLHDQPSLAKGGSLNGEGASAADRKKAAKKAKKDAEKAEADKKAAAAAKPNAKADDEGTAKKEDTDPLGLELLKHEKPLDEALKYLTPMLELTPKRIDVQIAGFEVYLRRRKLFAFHNPTIIINNLGFFMLTTLSPAEKYLPAAKCLLAARALDPSHPKCHEHSLRLQHALAGLSEPLPPQIQSVLQSTFLSTLDPTISPQDQNEAHLQSHRESASHVHTVIRVRQALSSSSPSSPSSSSSVDDESAKKTQKANLHLLLSTLESPGISFREVLEGKSLLAEIGADRQAHEAYLELAGKRWPEATVLRG